MGFWVVFGAEMISHYLLQNFMGWYCNNSAYHNPFTGYKFRLDKNKTQQSVQELFKQKITIRLSNSSLLTIDNCFLQPVKKKNMMKERNQNINTQPLLNTGYIQLHTRNIIKQIKATK
jgi:hypothetical protein